MIDLFVDSFDKKVRFLHDEILAHKRGVPQRGASSAILFPLRWMLCSELAKWQLLLSAHQDWLCNLPSCDSYPHIIIFGDDPVRDVVPILEAIQSTVAVIGLAMQKRSQAVTSASREMLSHGYWLRCSSPHTS